MSCCICNKEMKRSAIPSHLKFVHLKDHQFIQNSLQQAEKKSTPSRVTMTISKETMECPKVECPSTSSNGTNLRRHFRSRHPRVLVVITDQDLVQYHNFMIYFLGNRISES